jgi:hypothetical protein
MPICYFYMLNYVYAILYSVDIHLVCALDWAIKTELFPSFSCLILKTYNSLVFLLSSSLLFPDLGNFYFSFPDVWDLLDLVWCVEIASCTSDLSNKVNSNIYICTWIRQSNPLLFVFKLLPGGLWKHYLTNHTRKTLFWLDNSDIDLQHKHRLIEAGTAYTTLVHSFVI